MLLFIVIGCGVSVKVITNTSRPEQPSWLDKLPVASDSLYFVGIKTKASTLEQGQTEAMQDALSKVSTYLDATVNFDMKIERKNEEKITTGFIKLRSGTKVIEASMADTYYIKTTYIGNRTIEEFNVYVLIKLPKDIIPKIRAANKEEKEKKADAAYELFQKAKDSEDKRMYKNALELYNQASNLLPDINEVINIKRGNDITNNIELNQTILYHVQNINQAMKRTFVIVNEKNMSVETEHSILAENLSEALTKNGYFLAFFPTQSVYRPTELANKILSGDRETINLIVRETGAMYIVVGRVNTNYSSYVMGQYCYYAIGEIKMIQAFGDNHIIENIPFKNSGFHQEREQAGLNALTNSGKEIGETIVKKLNEMVRYKEKQN